ncbi:hypothetical protein OPV22_009889 [Ensete ventricosum]|uniref:Uncharacterized protein n=1 Tax=Ensete ventricosum TaxID=4639 RepID=A0AAV8RK44_ENSVE|nr:hypothetical protein OPV22_009889 [Ensete ventricosum]
MGNPLVHIMGTVSSYSSILRIASSLCETLPRFTLLLGWLSWESWPLAHSLPPSLQRLLLKESIQPDSNKCSVFQVHSDLKC